MTRPTPRRPAPSRGLTPRPRRIAGQRQVLRADDPEPDGTEPDGTEPDGTGRVDRPGLLGRASTTRVLMVVLAASSVLLVALGVAVGLRSLSDGPERAAVAGGGVNVPADRPVTAAELAVIDGVDTAAKSAQEIVAVDYRSYDEEVDQAAALMTTSFEEQYRQTTADVKADFVAQQTLVQANVVAQGVVRANRTRLEALVFLNQVVTRTREGKPETIVTPYKVLVTMVHTNNGWLVDKLDTDEPKQDTTN